MFISFIFYGKKLRNILTELTQLKDGNSWSDLVSNEIDFDSLSPDMKILTDRFRENIHIFTTRKYREENSSEVEIFNRTVGVPLIFSSTFDVVFGMINELKSDDYKVFYRNFSPTELTYHVVLLLYCLNFLAIRQLFHLNINDLDSVKPGRGSRALRYLELDFTWSEVIQVAKLLSVYKQRYTKISKQILSKNLQFVLAAISFGFPTLRRENDNFFVGIHHIFSWHEVSLTLPGKEAEDVLTCFQIWRNDSFNINSVQNSELSLMSLPDNAVLRFKWKPLRNSSGNFVNHGSSFFDFQFVFELNKAILNENSIPSQQRLTIFKSVFNLILHIRTRVEAKENYVPQDCSLNLNFFYSLGGNVVANSELFCIRVHRVQLILYKLGLGVLSVQNWNVDYKFRADTVIDFVVNQAAYNEHTGLIEIPTALSEDLAEIARRAPYLSSDKIKNKPFFLSDE
jgi:hypothetical protein